MNFEEIKETIRAGVVVAMDFSRELTDEEVLSLIDEGILKFETRGSISLGERIRLKREIFNSLRKLDIIQEYLEDDRITEIMINGREGIFLEKNGRVIRSEKCFKRDGRLEDIVQQIVAGCNRSVNEE